MATRHPKSPGPLDPWVTGPEVTPPGWHSSGSPWHAPGLPRPRSRPGTGFDINQEGWGDSGILQGLFRIPLPMPLPACSRRPAFTPCREKPPDLGRRVAVAPGVASWRETTYTRGRPPLLRGRPPAGPPQPLEDFSTTSSGKIRGPSRPLQASRLPLHDLLGASPARATCLIAPPVRRLGSRPVGTGDAVVPLDTSDTHGPAAAHYHTAPDRPPLRLGC